MTVKLHSNSKKRIEVSFKESQTETVKERNNIRVQTILKVNQREHP